MLLKAFPLHLIALETIAKHQAQNFIWTELFLVITGETKLPKLCNHSFGDSRGRPRVLSNRGVGSIPTA